MARNKRHLKNVAYQTEDALKGLVVSALHFVWFKPVEEMSSVFFSSHSEFSEYNF